MNHSRFYLPIAVALVMSQPSTGRPQGVGTVRGSVTIRSIVPSAASARTNGSPYGRPGGETSLSKDERIAQTLAEVVLYIADDNPEDGIFAGQSYRADAGSQNPAITQEEKEFMPHVLPVIAGTSVSFPNNDPFYHNVFSLSAISKFDLGKYSRKDPAKSYTFARPGIAKIFCDIHRTMKANILVLEHPFFTRTDRAGAFVLEKVPVGKWRIVAWHPDLKAASRDIHLQTDQVLNVTFDLEP